MVLMPLSLFDRVLPLSSGQESRCTSSLRDKRRGIVKNFSLKHLFQAKVNG